MCQGCWCTTDLETEKIFAEERLSEGLIQSGWGVPWDSAISCLLSTPCSLSLLSCSFFPQPFLIRTPSWVLISTVSVFHVGLCTQATSMTIINNMRGKMGHDSCWKMTRANFGRRTWKYPEKEQQGQSWWGVCVLRHPLCQPKPFSQLLVHCQKDWLAPDTSDQLPYPQPFFSLGNHELFTGSFSRFRLHMWHLKLHTVMRLMSHPCECTSGYTCSHVCTPG